MKVVSCFFLILCFLPPRLCTATDLNGHFKSLNIYQQTTSAQGQDVWLSADSLRLDLSGKLKLLASAWQISLDQLFLYQDPRDSLPLPVTGRNRIEELAWDGNSGHALSWQLQIDRLSLQWDWDATVLTVGRQAVGFGRISLFSPLDIIAPFAPTELDSEVRPGVDALRVRQYFDIVGEAGATLVVGEKQAMNSALGDLTLNAGKIDFLLIGGRLRDRSMIGFGMSGQLGGLGVKGEWAGYNGSEVGRLGGDLHEKFSIAGFEFEYRFPIDLILQLQYLYNGPGSDNPVEYPLVAQSASIQEGLTYLYGKHYLLSGLSRDLTPLVRLFGLAILNLKDDSWLFRPLIEVSLMDNISLDIFWNFYQGDEPHLVAGQLLPRSEFGSVEDSGGFLLKMYF